MAYRHSLTYRSILLKRKHHPSPLSFIIHQHNEDPKQQSNSNPNLLHQHTNFTLNSSFQDRLASSSGFSFSYLTPSIGSSFCRYMSTIGEGSADEIGLISDVVLTDSSTVVQSVAPAVNEVAAAAADSFLPVAVLQHVIDAVHSFTGLNWWAAIILTTVMIRIGTVPLLINQLKATSKLTLMRPRLEEIKQQMQDTAMDPASVAEGQKRMSMLFKEFGVSPFTPLKGLFIQGPVFVCFFLAIQNMAEKVPSFKNGGAFWFVDLTTPDTLYIFPVLTALTFWITVEFNMQEGMEGNPIAGTMKNVSRVLAAASVPLTMSFPKAIFCYWITSNFFSFAYGGVIKYPGVKKYLGVPEIPVAPPSTTPQTPFSLSAVLKQALASKQIPATSSPVESQSKGSNQRITSTSVLSQKIKSLEKQVKGRKKNKKR
ncbi:mitochondrial inner membrane protein OXA1 [Mercurialis annua]|uniref:mitochondrial inner membrane protein OXA1 n=1 Tax=Mercurialis annua TaxID=3986 RepID=UPI002160E830|nr:mitochondrial inner membrane protein OXA1 [Mercurialis annua]